MGRGKVRRAKIRKARLGGVAKGVFKPVGKVMRKGKNLPGHGGHSPHPRPKPPFPRDNMRGVSLSWLRRNKPKGWREVPTRDREGWIWKDENGVERLRFMRPSGTNPANSQWSRQANGYFRWQPGHSTPERPVYLDIDGNEIPPTHPLFNELTHIMYEGP
jgi:hypothetical protein